jgi:hypothetical protein
MCRVWLLWRPAAGTKNIKEEREREERDRKRRGERERDKR